MAWVIEDAGRLQGSDQNHFPGWKRSHPLSWKSKRGNCAMEKFPPRSWAANVERDGEADLKSKCCLMVLQDQCGSIEEVK